MTRLLRLLFVMFVLTSISAFANSVNLSNLSVNFSVSPNFGSGDNIGGMIFGPGQVNLYVAGGTPGYWFSDGGQYMPGSMGGGDTTIFYDTFFGNIGSTGLGGENGFIFASSLYTGTFTFPTNGENFTVTMPAFLDPITIYNCTSSSTCTTFTLQARPGTLTLSFNYFNGSYYANSGSFITNVPEPGTVGLMGIGVGAVIWCAYKRKWANRRTV